MDTNTYSLGSHASDRSTTHPQDVNAQSLFLSSIRKSIHRGAVSAAAVHDQEADTAEGAAAPGSKTQAADDEILKLFAPNLNETSFPAGPELDPCKNIPASRKKRPPHLGPSPSTLGTGLLNEKFKVRMKTGTLHHDFTEYIAEIPPRAALRLEYLLGTNKVHLNDRHYMHRLHAALVDSEKEAQKREEEERELAEQERVKKLVVEGFMPPPVDMQYLYDHPVFQVNSMLRRIEDLDTLFAAPPAPPYRHLIQVEPFEYEEWGGEFFKHLHRTGRRDWAPEHVMKEREEKIERARERKRHALAAAVEDGQDHGHDEDQHQAKTDSHSKAIETIYQRRESHGHGEHGHQQHLVAGKGTGKKLSDPTKAAAAAKPTVTGKKSSSSSWEWVVTVTDTNSSSEETDSSFETEAESESGSEWTYTSGSGTSSEASAAAPPPKPKPRLPPMSKELLAARAKELAAADAARVREGTQAALTLHIARASKRGILNTGIMEELRQQKIATQAYPAAKEEEMRKLKDCYRIKSQEELTKIAGAKPAENKALDCLEQSKTAEELFECGHTVRRFYLRQNRITDEFCKYLGRFMVQHRH